MAARERQTDSTGIEWVNVCPGTFTMGTITGEDTMANQDEIVDPPRTVVLSALQIAATETTQQQYGQTGDEPVVDVTWHRPGRSVRKSVVICRPKRSGNMPLVVAAAFRGRLGMMMIC